MKSLRITTFGQTAVSDKHSAWPKVLKAWAKHMDAYIDVVTDDPAPYAYNERANVSLLTAGIVRALNDAVVMEEYTCWREGGGGEGPRKGRADLWTVFPELTRATVSGSRELDVTAMQRAASASLPSAARSLPGGRQHASTLPNSSEGTSKRTTNRWSGTSCPSSANVRTSGCTCRRASSPRVRGRGAAGALPPWPGRGARGQINVALRTTSLPARSSSSSTRTRISGSRRSAWGRCRLSQASTVGADRSRGVLGGSPPPSAAPGVGPMAQPSAPGRTGRLSTRIQR